MTDDLEPVETSTETPTQRQQRLENELLRQGMPPNATAAIPETFFSTSGKSPFDHEPPPKADPAPMMAGPWHYDEEGRVVPDSFRPAETGEPVSYPAGDPTARPVRYGMLGR